MTTESKIAVPWIHAWLVGQWTGVIVDDADANEFANELITHLPHEAMLAAAVTVMESHAKTMQYWQTDRNVRPWWTITPLAFDRSPKLLASDILSAVIKALSEGSAEHVMTNDELQEQLTKAVTALAAHDETAERKPQWHVSPDRLVYCDRIAQLTQQLRTAKLASAPGLTGATGPTGGPRIKLPPPYGSPLWSSTAAELVILQQKIADRDAKIETLKIEVSRLEDKIDQLEGNIQPFDAGTNTGQGVTTWPSAQSDELRGALAATVAEITEHNASASHVTPKEKIEAWRQLYQTDWTP